MALIAPNKTPIQVEGTRATSAVSEALIQQMGGNINHLLHSVLPIGTVIPSMLNEAQFQSESSTDWVLADGRGVADSRYALITGRTTAPDLRGLFLRGKNYGRSVSSGNPDGDLSIGQYQADEYKHHQHGVDATKLMEVGGQIVHDDGSEFLVTGAPATAEAGGNETRARNVTVNYFIKIN